MSTKKTLVPIDLQRPDKKIKGFLYPNIDLGIINSFIEINKGKEWEAGMVVYTGKEVTKNDIFAKIVDSGKKIESVNYLLNSLEEYLNQVSLFKIGDIVILKPTENGFKLEKIQKPSN